MTDDAISPLKRLEREHARLLAEAVTKDAEAKAAAARAEEVARDMAALARLTETYNLTISGPAPAALATSEAVSGSLTFSTLIAAFKADPESSYNTVQFSTRTNYDSLTRRLEREIGDQFVSEFQDDEVQTARIIWTHGGHFAIADSLTGMLRILASYGASALKSKECRALKAITGEMTARSYKPRTERLTEDWARKIIAEANRRGLCSLALTQAIQFDCALKQTVVIGQWVPISEQGVATDITISKKKIKWLPGLRWSSIDFARMILRHPKGECDLRNAQLVKDQLAHMGSVQVASDPLIVYEETGRPYLAHQFRRNWRAIARAVGVPANVKNSDTRPTLDEERAAEGLSSAARS